MSNIKDRKFERTEIQLDFEVNINGVDFEMPTKNISVGGVCLDSMGMVGMEVGQICTIKISHDLEAKARIVGIQNAMINLEFIDADLREIQNYIQSLKTRGG